MGAVAAVPYLLRRTNSYSFRRVVPRHLVHRLGRREVKVSLRTVDLSVARRRARALANRFEEMIEMIDRATSITTDEIERHVRDYMAREWACAERDALREDLDPAEEVEVAEEAVEELGRRVRDGVVDRAGLRQALGDRAPARGTPEERRACQAVHRAQREVQRIRSAMFSGRFDEAVPRDALFEGVRPARDREARPLTLPVVLERWAAECEPSRKALVEFRRAVRRFGELHGAVDVRHLTRDHVREFKDALLRLPTRFPGELAGKPLPEVLRLSEGADLPRASHASVNKALGSLHALLEWCLVQGHLESNVAHGLKVRGKAAYERGAPYSTDDLRRLFAMPVYSRGERPRGGAGECAHWLPLLALYTGARLGELCQLRVRDVRRESDVWFLDVNDEGEGRSVKTRSSVRRVPVHPRLVELGLLRYVEGRRRMGPDATLWPDLRPDGRGDLSGNFSKWWGRYFRKHAGIDDPRKVFHSFRHTFKDACRRAGLGEEVHDALTGHSGGGVGRSYGSGVPLRVLAEALAKVGYPGFALPKVKQA